MKNPYLALAVILSTIGCRSSSPSRAADGDLPSTTTRLAEAALGCRVEGCVRNTGVQELAGQLTVREAILAAGPIAGRSDLEQVQLRRGHGDDQLLILIDVRGMLETGDSSFNVLLQPGDVLRVPELPDLPAPGDG